MDQESIEDLLWKEKEGLDRKEFVEDLSRSYRAWRKKSFFKGGKTHKDECNKQATQPKIQANILSSQNISQHICKASIDPNTHIHTQQV